METEHELLESVPDNFNFFVVLAHPRCGWMVWHLHRAFDNLGWGERLATQAVAWKWRHDLGGYCGGAGGGSWLQRGHGLHGCCCMPLRLSFQSRFVDRAHRNRSHCSQCFPAKVVGLIYESAGAGYSPGRGSLHIFTPCFNHSLRTEPPGANWRAPDSACNCPDQRLRPGLEERWMLVIRGYARRVSLLKTSRSSCGWIFLVLARVLVGASSLIFCFIGMLMAGVKSDYGLSTVFCIVERVT